MSSFSSVEAHFASVENNILSDIRNYHMMGQQMSKSSSHETTDEMSESDEEEENMDQYIISRFTPERASWRSQDPPDGATDSAEEWWVAGVQTVDSCTQLDVLQVGQAR